MRHGVRLGIDVGRARIGVARCDPHGLLATPVETIPRDTSNSTDLERIATLVDEMDAIEVVVGLPLNLRGEHTPSTADAEEFAHAIARRLADRDRLSVRMVDERMSTVSAQSNLHQVGKKTKQSRAIIDQAAAVVILQHALDIERARDAAPGVEVVGAHPSPEAGSQ